MRLDDPEPCIYCGEPATGVDHVIPKSFIRRMIDINPTSATFTVPACLDCNVRAGDKMFRTLGEKRRYIRQSIRRRYAKYLNMPVWEEEEIAELGPTIQSSVRHALQVQSQVRQRLEYQGLAQYVNRYRVHISRAGFLVQTAVSPTRVALYGGRRDVKGVNSIDSSTRPDSNIRRA